MIRSHLRHEADRRRGRRHGPSARFCLGLLVVLGACDHEPSSAPLAADEEALVHAYVRLTVAQALHDTAPDSVAAVLDVIGASVDSSAVRRALAGLSQEPMRWELVYSAIATQLEALEATPSLWWAVARGDTVIALQPPGASQRQAEPSGRTRAAGR